MPHLVLELGSAATQLELACIGLGVAVVPGYAAQEPGTGLQGSANAKSRSASAWARHPQL
jgi:DNA-binding transcriptional LysR family regulator